MQVTDKLQKLVESALQQLKIELDQPVTFEHPAEKEHGDYATNVALVVWSQLDDKQQTEFKNSRDLAEKIATEIEVDASLLSKTEVAGPGFINFTLSEHFLLDQLNTVLTKSDQLVEQLYSGKKMVVEFTDPNPFKQLHIGHLYSNTVGESICRLLEATGAEVRRADYFGDVGLHVAKSIWGMREKILHEREESVADTIADLAEHPLADRVKFLGESYALGATSYKNEEENAQRQITQLNKLIYVIAQDIMVAEYDWQPVADYKKYLDTDTEQNWNYDEIKLLYQQGKAWSLAYFDSMYDRVGMSFDNYYPESVTGEYGLKLVEEGLEKGVFKESQGAVVYEGDEDKGLHTRVFVNSAGLPTYETKELGLGPAKWQDGEYDYSLIITGNEIDEYFQVLLAAMSELQPEIGEKTHHLGHGMVRLPEGKMSSRTGDVITAEWLLDEAAGRIRDVLKDAKKGASAETGKMTADERGMSAEMQADVAEKVGQAAIKYAFLKSNIGKDIAFSFDESLSFQGNSGPYLQYSYVRCQSVLNKAGLGMGKDGQNQANLSDSDTLRNIKVEIDGGLEPAECDLLRNLYTYSEVVSFAAKERAPHRVCGYLYELAQSFNQFYTQCPILNVEDRGEGNENVKQLRLALVMATAEILTQGLGLLNIPLVGEM